ncbi:serine-threonine protein phosphatase, putative [Bodo saltans]|uniref:Serine/threonine-protein phosphatase n=1 Tax=Bodo saltans TaxID=75058 RepID=A0A0S4JE35_BODSA|nr:serine-threonine protein phosphatase, putative [Bodo saltans]|eukprot:CUG88381.1 serine-threonine protein phosphatase, putative [Bodo saltans]
MGCNNSKQQATKTSTSQHVPAKQPTRIESGTLCHFCKKRFPEHEHSNHTVMCDEREVTCWNSWCREIVKQGVLAAHMEQCARKQKTICSKCGAHVLVSELPKHRDTCQLQVCTHCGESCIARILKYCPHQTLGKISITSGPFATEALRSKFCPNENASPIAVANFNVARLQQLWRWMKTRSVVEDTIFRLIHKEMDLKKEGFAIFKAHDKLDKPAGSAPKKSRSVLNPPVVAPATSSHYFPSNSKIPITFDHIRQMIRDLASHTLLPYPAAWRVFTDTLNHLNTLPNVVRLMPPVGARVVNGRTIQGGKTIVVGDLHGQLADLLHIIREGGMPDDSTFYIFNGDFVDRGPYGVEVLLVLFSLMLAFPKYVALNRGNHECDYMNEEYGFDVEVSTKYDRNMFRLIQRCFCALPLATMVGRDILVVHGGLPRRNGVTIDDICRIQRFRQIPMPEHTQPEEDEMFQDLVWSDPWENLGWKESERGAGVQFGPDVTRDFCKTNQLQLVIRSHEEYQKGYEEHHQGKLVTVFSASNYDGPDTNKGSFMVLVGDNPEPSYHLYQVYEDDLDEYNQTELNETMFLGTAATPTLSRAMGGSFASLTIQNRQKKRARDEVLRVLRERIFQRRHRMLAYFTKLDRSRKGSVWKIEWVETMRNVLNLHLPWFFLRQYIVAEDPQTSRIFYSGFLNQFRNKLFTLWMNEWETGMSQQLVARQRTVQRAQHIEAAFSKGLVNYNEFCSAMRSIDYTMSDAQLFQLFQYYDDNGSAQVDGPQLLKELQNARSVPQCNPLKWDLDAMEQLQTIVIQGRSQLPTLFKINSRDRTVSKEKYIHGMTQLCRGMKNVLSPQQRDAIYTFLTGNKDEIDWDAFIAGFAIIDTTRKVPATTDLLRRYSVAEFDVPLTPVGQIRQFPGSPTRLSPEP